MFVLVFGTLAPRDCFAVSMACTRFHRIIFRPMNALLTADIFTSFCVTTIGDDDMPVQTHNLLQPPCFSHGVFRVKADRRPASQYGFIFPIGTTAVSFDSHPGESNSVLAQAVFVIFEQLAARPSLRYMFTKMTCAHQGWQEMAFEFTINVAWVKRAWSVDAPDAPRSALGTVFWAFQNLCEHNAVYSVSHAMRTHLAKLEDSHFNRAFMGMEPAPVDHKTLAIQVDMHPYQLSAVAWMRQREDAVLTGKSLGTFDFYYTPPYLIGTGLRCSMLNAVVKDPASFTTTPAMHENPVWHAMARGVVIADQVGLGKTRETVAFVLGTRQDASVFADCQEDETASAPRDRLVLTRAVDFGAYHDRFKCVVDNGLIHTRASLVIVPTTLVNAWTTEIRAAYPDKKLLVLTQKSNHENCTYLELATADIVLVTAHFLTNRKYYVDVRWGKLEPMSSRTPCLLLALQLESFGRFFAQCGRLDVLAHAKAPCLEYFAWERVVVDEVHKFASAGASGTTFLEMGVNFFSARFVVGVSATFSGIPFGTSLGLANHVSDWLGLGVCTRCHAISESSVFGEETSMRRHSKVLALSAIVSAGRSIHYGRHDLAGYWVERIYDGIARMLLTSVYRRNTQINTASRVFVPVVDDITIEYTPHIVARMVSTIARHLGVTTNVDPRLVIDMCFAPDNDVPPDSMRDKFVQRLRLAPGYATLFHQAMGEVEARSERLCILAHAMSHVPASAKEGNAFYDFTADPMYPTSVDWIQQQAVDVMRVCTLLAEFRTRVQSSYPFFDDLEHDLGTKAYLLDQYLRHIFTDTPEAKVIVASVYAMAVKTILKRILGPMGKRFVSMGGLNAGSTRKNEKLFTQGDTDCQVLYINMNQAADGLNLQCASYIIEFDGLLARNHPQMVQLYGRVQRQGSLYYPVIIHLQRQDKKKAQI